ncbi:hypothetical protein FNV43_RR09419 [Rhamnella rubrinervis]|uniref:DUF7890 domain-containing protein n=1 Tax=Rhamnella rubrinervis TaxID=2594499 RepID=A0A8K0HAF1_9ROSA|nr:hypothetical protein FNV43_RR09419 [Rhamnella rubrinervis]
MMNSVFAFFNSLDEMLQLKQPNATNNIIYRDDLRKKPSPKKLKKAKHLEALSEPLLKKEQGKNFGVQSYGPKEDKEVIRVKVVMTKQEAARMLSKCRDGGVLGFKDVASEIIELPPNRVTIVPPSTGSGHAVLKTIPEEV